MIHHLKIDREAFNAIRSGKKTAEIRFNDRQFQVGDELVLQETVWTGAEMANGAPLQYSGRRQSATVTHIQTGYGLAPDWVSLSIKNATDGSADEGLTDSEIRQLLIDVDYEFGTDDHGLPLEDGDSPLIDRVRAAINKVEGAERTGEAMATVSIIIADVRPEDSGGDNLRVRFVFDPPITEESGAGTPAQLLAMDAIRWLGDQREAEE